MSGDQQASLRRVKKISQIKGKERVSHVAV